MLYETCVKSRMSTEEKLRDYPGQRSRLIIAAELYYENDVGLLRKIEWSKRRLLKLARQQAEIELALWRDVLRSNKTTARGLRSTIRRIRDLCTALSRDDTFIQVEIDTFERQVRWRRARETLSGWRNWRAGIIEHACRERSGRTQNVCGPKTWSSEDERRLRVRMRREFKLANDSVRPRLKRRLRDAGLTLAELGATKREIRLLSK